MIKWFNLLTYLNNYIKTSQEQVKHSINTDIRRNNKVIPTSLPQSENIEK